jgi:uncharacterized membrane protein YcaP (DUF421 family)
MNINWHDMFVVDLALILEKILRPTIVYVFLIVGLRLAGKRELAQLNPFDFIVLMTLSNTLQNAIIGNDNTITGGIIGAVTLLAANYFVVKYLHRHRKMADLFVGHRDVLIKDGKLLKDHLDREMMTRAELVAAAHKQGLASLGDIKNAVIEPTGTITFIANTPTAADRLHNELMDAIKSLQREIAELKAK